MIRASGENVWTLQERSTLLPEKISSTPQPKISIPLQPMNALVDQLVLCENGESVESVFVDGKPVMSNKRLLTIDEEAIFAKLSSLRPRIARAHAAASSFFCND
jgi:hypothetical protein